MVLLSELYYLLFYSRSVPQFNNCLLTYGNWYKLVMKRWPLVLGIIFILLGIIGMVVVNFYYFQPFGFRRGGYRRGPGLVTENYDSNGEQIYFTGISRKGSVSSTGGAIWFQMHGGGCVKCHGADGRGGRIVTMMGSFTAHDIRYSSLIKEKPPFNIKTIKRAITEGKDQEGKRLNSNMPIWNMSEEDLDNAVDYLKSL